HAFDQEVVRLRDRLLPVARLTEVLQNGRALPAKGGTNDQAATFLAVVKAGTRRFGLVVDEILNTEEVVVKPMHGALRTLLCFAGATIMGDGRVALILSTEGIARQARLRFAAAELEIARRRDDRGPEAQAVLLFRYGPREQFALPLAQIRRIEAVRMDR